MVFKQFFSLQNTLMARETPPLPFMTNAISNYPLFLLSLIIKSQNAQIFYCQIEFLHSLHNVLCTRSSALEEGY